jgi:hypothetical protein
MSSERKTYDSVLDRATELAIPFAVCIYTLTWREEHTCYAQLRLLLLSRPIPIHDIIIVVVTAIVQEG